MKGRDSSYSAASGAVIFQSKWDVFVSGPWEGIFSCVGKQCAVTDSNTQRTSALVLIHKHARQEDDAGECWVSPLHRGGGGNIFGLLIYGSTAPFSLCLTQTHTHTQQLLLYNLDLSDVRFRGRVQFTLQVVHYREKHHTLQHVCVHRIVR